MVRTNFVLSPPPVAIQHALRSDEQLLWWDCPRWKHIKLPHIVQNGSLTLVSGTIIALVWGVILYGVSARNWETLTSRFLSNIPLVLFTIAFFIFMVNSRSWWKSFTMLRNEIPYRKYTLYAITNQRVCIIIKIPGLSPKEIEYLPSEINPIPAAELLRRDGSGSLPFSVARHIVLGKYRSSFDFPGLFWGIAHVPHVTYLLQTLQSQSQTVDQ